MSAAEKKSGSSSDPLSSVVSSAFQNGQVTVLPNSDLLSVLAEIQGSLVLIAFCEFTLECRKQAISFTLESSLVGRSRQLRERWIKRGGVICSTAFSLLVPLNGGTTFCTLLRLMRRSLPLSSLRRVQFASFDDATVRAFPTLAIRGFIGSVLSASIL